MALTTQCPNCRTAFRVVNDQLKLRGGLVRCGHCQIVFNAQEHLLPDAPAPDISPMQVAFTEQANALAQMMDVGFLEPKEAPAEAQAEEKLEAEVEFIEAAPPPEPEAESESEAEPEAEAEAPTESTDELEAHIDSAALAEEEAVIAETSAEEEGQAEEEADEEEETEDEDYVEPEFVLRARAAQRRARIMRWVMGIGSVVLLAGAAAQGLFVFRNQLAGAYPQARPYIADACALLGCRIGLPAQIEAVTIESTELQQQPDKPELLTLALLLRNRSASVQSWPNLEVSLLEANGRALVRKVIAPADYLPAPKEAAKGFAANAEQSLSLALTVGSLKPTDYRVYVFYP